MAKYFGFGIAFLFSLLQPSIGQKKLPLFINPKIMGVCYGDQKIANTFVPPPKLFMEAQAKGTLKKSNIIVDYIGFSSEARKAFQYAVDIWETILSSDVPIRMEAHWSDLGANVLGNCYSNGYYLGLATGARLPFAYYPVAIAEKILKKEINDTLEPDLIANFSNSAPWYYGTDGNPPNDKYDLATVVLHEIGHGIGFIGTMDGANNEGSYGFPNGLTNIFDHFIENAAGITLLDTLVFPNPSSTLYSSLTNQSLYFDSKAERVNNNGNTARLYAPQLFDAGSSVYHLNEITYPSGNQNSLMTPFTSKAEAIHDPGPITIGMAADWGWVHTWIEHKPLNDRESLSDTSRVIATITSDTAFYPDSTYLFFSYNDFTTFDSIPLSATNSANEFKSVIPVDSLDRTVSYFLSTVDTFGRVFTNPPGAPNFYYQYYVGPDTIKPTITHFPVEFIIFTKDTLKISAAVTDNIGIDSVFVTYYLNETEQPTLFLHYDSLADYSGNLVFQPGELMPGDSIRYRITAVDSSLNANHAFSPDSAYYTIRVEDIRNPQNAYQNSFDSVDTDFLTTGFSITTVSGFANGALHTKHPYESPDQDNQHLEYIAQLKIPIILKANDSYMRFDEIVLVEPGETGTKWGDEQFWDYVVIEGSKDGGKIWNPFENGYDCRKESIWFSKYNSSIVDQNSTAIGDSDLYRSHLVNLLGSSYFIGGDTVLIRFRLYSDPYAHGWGWVLDNLEIQGTVSSVQNPFDQKEILKVFPNPFRSVFEIELQNLPLSVHEFSVTVSDLLGREILFFDRVPYNRGLKKTIDLSSSSNGIYLIDIRAGNFRKVIQVVKTR